MRWRSSSRIRSSVGIARVSEIHGQQKTSFLKLAIDPVAGSTLLHFNEDATQNGWHVGDKIVVTSTHFVPPLLDAGGLGLQDEIRTIKAIYGSTIVLDRPLTYNHDTPRADLKAYVADYTRNVVVETQNADNVPVSQRGHIMFMHNPSVDVEYAELSELGRTDKSVRAVDAETTAGIKSDTNVKGRYALHLHETGVAPGTPEAIIKGNAVWGSPGWGIVQHASNADVENNATFNTFGAGYVSETGDETGLWQNNIAIQAHGVGLFPDDKFVPDVAAFDLARTGIGFYFQGRMIKAIDNVAADVNEGFVYMVRGAPATIAADDLAQPEILHGLSSSDVAAAPIQNFNNNEVLAASYGFIVVKASPAQDHDVRSVIDGFKAWETDVGIHLEYTSHYTILNSDLIGSSVGGDATPVGYNGVQLGTSTFDIVLNKDSISNFRDGVVLEKQNSNVVSNGNFGYVFIDVKTQGIIDAAIKNLDLNHDQILSSDQLKAGPSTLHLNMSWENIPVWDFSWPDGRSVSLEGTKTDSIGTVPYAMGNETFIIGEQQMGGLLSHQGYYTTDDGRKIVILEEYYSDRATGEIFKTSFPIQLADNVPLVQDPYFLRDGDAISLGRIDLNAAAPIANADTTSTAKATSVVLDVLKNDVDPSGLAMSIDGLTQPAHGTVKENSDGTLTYAPDKDFTGVESFKYWLTDHNAKVSGQTVTVKVGLSEGSHNIIPVEEGSSSNVSVKQSPSQIASSTSTSVSDTEGKVADSSAGGELNPTGGTVDHPQGEHPQGGLSSKEAGGGSHPANPDPETAVVGTSKGCQGSYAHLSVIYDKGDKGFGATAEVGSQSGIRDHLAYAGDQLVWRSSAGTHGVSPLPPSSSIDLHQEAGSRGLFFEEAESGFAFKNFDAAGFNLAHPETSLLPEIEHHSLVASGFMFP
jgi:hypothetical protein